MGVAMNTIVSWTDPSDHDHHGAVVAHIEGHDVIACAMCGFLHLVPVPTPEEMERVCRALEGEGLGVESVVIAAKS